MEILDEQGRLFGRVNIVDALVVLFAVAVIVAGAALVFGGDSSTEPTPEPEPEEATMYVTLATIGEEATALDTGEIQVGGASANVSDVHRTAGPRSYFRVALDGTLNEGVFRFQGDPVRFGDTYTVTDNTTRTELRVVERDVRSEFETRTTTVTVETTLRTPIADAVSEGDVQRVGDVPVLTIESTETTPVNDTQTYLRATLNLETRVVDGVPHYAGRPVRLGRELGIRTNEYEFDAEVVAKE